MKLKARNLICKYFLSWTYLYGYRLFCLFIDTILDLSIRAFTQCAVQVILSNRFYHFGDSILLLDRPSSPFGYFFLPAKWKYDVARSINRTSLIPLGHTSIRTHFVSRVVTDIINSAMSSL